jgi:hypothetical protein
MKKSALMVFLMLSACEKDDTLKDVGIIDRIKMFFGLTQPDIPVEDTRLDGQTRIIPPIKSEVSNGDWAGGEVAVLAQPELLDGPGRIMSAPGVNNTDSSSKTEDMQQTDSSVLSGVHGEEDKTVAEIPVLPSDLNLDSQPDNSNPDVDLNKVEDAHPLVPDSMPALVYGSDMPTDENAPLSIPSQENNIDKMSPQEKPWSSAGVEYGFPGEGRTQEPVHHDLPIN